jgi:tRNA (guanine-N7-)-methyltransferase
MHFMIEPNNMQKRPIRSFVTREGRISPRQEKGWKEYFPLYQSPRTLTPVNFPDLFARKAPLIVEIGFGMGASLLEMAKAEPNRNFLGIEVHKAGVGALSASLYEEKIENVRIAMQDAVLVCSTQISPASLTGIQIYFPDPWPKKRHHKRRLLQKDFLNLLVSRLEPQAFLHIATDWEEYAYQIKALLDAQNTLVNTEMQGGFAPKPSRRPLTKFEQRGTHLGHGVWDLLYTKK